MKRSHSPSKGRKKHHHHHHHHHHTKRRHEGSASPEGEEEEGRPKRIHSSREVHHHKKRGDVPQPAISADNVKRHHSQHSSSHHKRRNEDGAHAEADGGSRRHSHRAEEHGHHHKKHHHKKRHNDEDTGGGETHKKHHHHHHRRSKHEGEGNDNIVRDSGGNGDGNGNGKGRFKRSHSRKKSEDHVGGKKLAERGETDTQAGDLFGSRDGSTSGGSGVRKSNRDLQKFQSTPATMHPGAEPGPVDGLRGSKRDSTGATILSPQPRHAHHGDRVGHVESSPILVNQSEVTELESYFQVDAHMMIEHFKSAFVTVTKNLKKPNVLIVGITGVGKSSLINSVFRSKIAQTGSGKPITQHFTKYDHENSPIVLYDSRGLEHGQHEQFMSETREFFEEHSASMKGDTRQAVHVVWYIINAASARFQDFEEMICRTVFNNVPIIFIINKADLVDRKDLEHLRVVLEDLKLPNCIAVLETVSSDHAKLQVDSCPKCKSEDLAVNTKKRRALCENCGNTFYVEVKTGLEEVVSTTNSTLPKVVREAFVSAQFVSFSLKDSRAAKIILDFSKEFQKVHLGSSLMRITAKMLTRLSILWDFRQHGHLYGTKIAKDIVHVLSMRDRLFLMLNKHRNQLLHICALGVVWNDFVRSLAMKVFKTCVEAREAMIDSNWHNIMETAFAEINDENITQIEAEMNEAGLKEFLERHCGRISDATPAPTPTLGVHHGSRPNSRPASRAGSSRNPSNAPSRENSRPSSPSRDSVDRRGARTPD